MSKPRSTLHALCFRRAERTVALARRARRPSNSAASPDLARAAFQPLIDRLMVDANGFHGFGPGLAHGPNQLHRADAEGFLWVAAKTAEVLLFHPAALPAECLVLVLKPGECLLKMPRIKIRPIFIHDIKIRIN